MKEIVVGSGNRGKVQEIQMLLAHLDVQILSLEDFPMAPAVNEDQETLEGNAVKKAREIFEFTGLPTISDDTGLEVAALDGRPGVHSARYAGPASDAEANRVLLLEELDGIENRNARFRTVAAYFDGEDTFVFEGVCEGMIAREEKGNEGFGYDALFIPAGSNRTFAEMTIEEKNLISHRSDAFRKLVSFLESELSP